MMPGCGEYGNYLKAFMGCLEQPWQVATCPMCMQVRLGLHVNADEGVRPFDDWRLKLTSNYTPPRVD